MKKDLEIRFSMLKAAARSGAHARLAVRGAELDETYAMERGTATHHILFGTKKIVGWEERRPRRGKDYDAFVLANPGAQVLTASEYEKSHRLADAIRENELAMELLTGEYEQTLRWKDNGLAMRATPDVRGIDYLAELKTCADASPERFPWHARKMAYHAQLAMQAEAMAKCGHGTPNALYLIAVESSAPYPVTVLRLTDRAIDEGRRLYRLWLERLRGFLESNVWPPYSQCVVPFDVQVEDEPDLVFGEEEAA